MDSNEEKYLQNIRRHLHRHPEISGREKETAAFIHSELEKTDPDEILAGVGGTGIVAIYGTDREGPQLMFRAELDALPIDETGDLEYRSENSGSSHACGHDGHMAVMIGLARYVKNNRPTKGRVLILFQPSEETGEGAKKMMSDSEFEHLKLDRSYAFHNLPGFEKGKVYYREGTFAAASVGLQFNFSGATSHAAYPEQGRNPAMALSKLIRIVQKAGDRDLSGKNFSLATTIFIRLGREAFGTNPGQAEMGVTLRAAKNQTLKTLREKVQKKAEELAEAFELELEIQEHEPFTATVNSSSCIEIVKRAAEKSGIEAEELENPFPWSEDFGTFGKLSDLGFVGIGSGSDHPHLHAGNYDFPDGILPAAVSLFINILEEEWKKS